MNSIASGSSAHVRIDIKAGTYTEKLTIASRTNLCLVGAGATSTILAYGDSNGSVGSTSGSASVLISANDFSAANLTIQNTFGSGSQAVALRTTGLRQQFLNCRFVGYQDTLYTHQGMQYFKNCYVQGNTDYVFGGYPKDIPFKEDDAKAPVNVYGATKAMGEDLALSVCDHVVIARVASLFGVAGASGKGGNFVETMLKLGRERGSVSVVADQFMSPTSTADAAKIILQAVQADVPSGIYHVVNSASASWWEFASRIFERCGLTVDCRPITAHLPLASAARAMRTMAGTCRQRVVARTRAWGGQTSNSNWE